MKLLLVVAYFVPEIGSAAHIYFDLAKAFVQRGHEVHVITSYPRKFNLSNGDFDRTSPLEESINGIYVHRYKHSAIRDNIVLRGMEHFLIPYYYFKLYKKLDLKFDICLVYIPPLPLYYFAQAIKKNYGVPSVLNYQDFHPQELTDVGMLKNRFLIKIMEYIEHQSYKNAEFITVLSEGGIDYVIRRGGDISKIEHIYNSCAISDLNESLTRQDFKIMEGIEDKILITYSGILSLPQGLDNILNAAKELLEHEDLIFYLIGDGMIKNHLVQRVRDEKISNVRILPLQPRDEYFNIVNSSDISLISLDERMKAPCIPGKLVNLMKGKKPIIAIVSPDSETARVITNSNSGIVVTPGDIEELKKAIMILKSNSSIRSEFGENGEKFLKNNMDLRANVIKYERIFNKIVSNI